MSCRTRRGCATRSSAEPPSTRAADAPLGYAAEATREATHELLASTLEHILRTFGAPPAPRRAHHRPEIRII